VPLFAYQKNFVFTQQNFPNLSRFNFVQRFVFYLDMYDMEIPNLCNFPLRTHAFAAKPVPVDSINKFLFAPGFSLIVGNFSLSI
jgi:hypothetical protein